jgi:hypothetical protein
MVVLFIYIKYVQFPFIVLPPEESSFYHSGMCGHRLKVFIGNLNFKEFFRMNKGMKEEKKLEKKNKKKFDTKKCF